MLQEVQVCCDPKFENVADTTWRNGREAHSYGSGCDIANKDLVAFLAISYQELAL